MILRDANRVPYTSLDSLDVVVATPTAFAGGTTNARGDDGGTSDPLTIFTVTGDVMIGVFGVCTTDLASAGGGNLSLGITGNATLFNAVTTATAIDQNEVWIDTTPAIGEAVDSLSFYIVGNGVDVVETVGTADITAGQIYYVALWRPLSPDSSVVAA